MILFYHLFLIAYKTGIHLVSFWNPKAKLWIEGRKNIFEKLQKALPNSRNQKIIWMHCASLGEFEQGRPVLEKLKEKNNDSLFVITFFSPSGYEIAKKKKDFDYVFYLPMDSKKNAKKWIQILKPNLVLWVKYEYWHFYLEEIKRNKIPLLMISGVYRSNQIFFKWYGKFYVKMLDCFSHFFVQNEDSQKQLQKIIPQQKITVSGDTRCDRVIRIAETFSEVPGIESFCGNKEVIVMGSTWEDDEAEWIHFVANHSEIKFIIAPHEIDEENLAYVRKQFTGATFYSEWLKKFPDFNQDLNCMIINNIGTLSRLYHYATITYVGGGFGDNGLHNILEAAVYGKPVIFGPHYEKNFEAQELINCSGGISIDCAIDLEKVVKSLLENKNELQSRSAAAKNYVYQNAGASDKIISFIEEVF